MAENEAINTMLNNSAGILIIKPDGMAHLNDMQKYLTKAGFKIESKIELLDLIPDKTVEELYPQYKKNSTCLEGLKKYWQSGKTAVLIMSSKQSNTQERLQQLIIRENGLPGPLPTSPEEECHTIIKDRIHCPANLKEAVRELPIILTSKLKTELFNTKTGRLKSLTVEGKQSNTLSQKNVIITKSFRMSIINLMSRFLEYTPEKTSDILKRAGMTQKEIDSEVIPLGRFIEILNKDKELKNFVNKIYLREFNKNLWVFTEKGAKGSKLINNIQSAGGDVLYLEQTAKGVFDQESSFSEINAVYRAASLISDPYINISNPEGHSDPFSILKQIRSLSKSISYLHYFNNHSIGADESTNGAIIRHVDFESKGRGELDFRLERVYSSLNAVSQKGYYLQNQQLKTYFQYMIDVLDKVEQTTKNKLYDIFLAPMMFCAKWDDATFQNIVNSHDIVELHQAIQHASPSFELPIDQTGDIIPFHPHCHMSSCNGFDCDVFKLLDQSLGLYESIQKPCTFKDGLILLDNKMWGIWAKCEDIIQKCRDRLQNVMNSIQLAEKEQPAIFSFLGDGWCFNFPFIEPPIIENGLIQRDGIIYFDGYRAHSFRNLSYKEFNNEKAVLNVISFDLKIEIKGKPVDVKYRIDQNHRIFYFDSFGRLKHITDNTHNNSIDFFYQTNTISPDLKYRRISIILDSAGNSYTFQYSDTAYSQTQNSLVITSRDSKGVECKKIRYKIEVERIMNYEIRKLISIEEADYQAIGTIEERYQRNKTSYEYLYYPLFEGLVPHYHVGDEIAPSTPITLNLPILKKEINPLGGETSFEYHESEFTTNQVSFLPNRPLWEINRDRNNVQIELVNYKMYRNLGFVRLTKRGTDIQTANSSWKEWYEFINRIDRIDLLKWKQTITLDKGKVAQNKYLYSWARGKYELHSRSTYPVKEWKKPKRWNGNRVVEWERVSFNDFVSGDYHISAGDYPGRIDYNPGEFIKNIESMITLKDLKERLNLSNQLEVYLVCLVLKMDIISNGEIEDRYPSIFIPYYAREAIKQLQKTVNDLRRNYTDYFINNHYNDIFFMAHDWPVIQGLDGYEDNFKNKLKEFQTQINNAFNEFKLYVTRKNYDCVNDLIGPNLTIKEFEHDDFGNIKTITTKNINIDISSINDPSYSPHKGIKKIFVYPPVNSILNRALTLIYGLPIEVKWLDVFDNNILKKINYEYSIVSGKYYSVMPEIKKVSGDTITMEYRYNEIDSNGYSKDPGACNKPTSITQVNANGTERITTEFKYNKFGDKVNKKDAENREIAYRYDGVEILDENVQSILNQSGLPYYYDDRFLNWIIRRGIDSNISQYLEHDKKGNLILFRDGNQNIFTYIYDNFDRLLKAELKPKDKQKITMIEYLYGDIPLNGLPKEVTRIRQRVSSGKDEYYETDIVSDKHGNLIKIKQYTGESTQVGDSVITDVFYDRVNRISKAAKNVNAITMYSYDYLDRMTVVKDPREGVQRTQYDDIYKYYDINGQKHSLRKMVIENPVGAKKTFYYDLLNRVKFVEMEVPIISNNIECLTKIYWEYHWDTRGLLSWITYPNKTISYNQYDNFDRVKIQGFERNQGEHIEISMDYNKTNQPIKITDENSNVTTYDYDNFGRLKTITRPLNDIKIYGYDNNDNTTSINHNGRVAVYGYNSQNLPETIQYPEEEIETYGYDLLGRLVTFNKKNKPPKKWNYSPFNQLITYEDEEGNVYKWLYNKYGGLVWSIEPRGKMTEKTYTTNYAGDMLKVTNSIGETMEYSRDKMGRPERVHIGPLNLEYFITHHPFGAVNSVTIGDCSRSTWKKYYDEMGRLVRSASPESRMTYINRDFLGRIINTYMGEHEEEKGFVYDNKNNLIKLTYAGKLVKEYKYDALDRLSAIIPYGNPTLETYAQEHHTRAATRLEYEDRGVHGTKVTITSPGNLSRIIESDQNHRITRILEAAEAGLSDTQTGIPWEKKYRITKYEYNAQGNPIQKQIYIGILKDVKPAQPSAAYTEDYDYYANGLIKDVQFCQDASVHWEYDPNGNISKFIDENNLAVELKYSEPSSLPTSITFPAGFSHTIKHDILGRPVYIDSGNPIRISYDDLNRQITWEQINGGQHTYFFDRDYFLSKYQKPNPTYPPILYAYDTAGRLSQITDSSGNITKYKWNQQGKYEQMAVKAPSLADFRSVQGKTLYYQDGKIQQIKDANGMSKYTYNLDGRIAQIDYDDPGHSWVRFEYHEGSGLLKQIKYSSGLSKRFEYNHLGNIVQIIENENQPGQRRIAFERDHRGKITKEYIDGNPTPDADIEYVPNNAIKKINGVVYSRDPATGQLKEVGLKSAEGKGFNLKFEYDENGRIKKQYVEENGSIRYYQGIHYDKAGRIHSIQNNSASYEIRYDPNGNPDSVKRTLSTGNTTEAHCTYDGDDRLRFIDEKTDHEIEYLYDECGNPVYEQRKAENATFFRKYDSANQIISISASLESPATTFSYDAKGNLTDISNGPAGKKTKFEYDGMHRLKNIKKKNTSETQYFPEEEFQYDALDRLRQDKHTAAGKTQELRHALVYPIELIDKNSGISTRFVPDFGNFRPFGSVAKGKPSYYIWIQGNCADVHNELGELLGTQTRLPYGDGVASTEARSLNPFGFKGYFGSLGPENIKWAFTRMYSPKHKSFLSPDILPGDIFNPISMNRRRIFNANPLRYVDLLGLEDMENSEGYPCDTFTETGQGEFECTLCDKSIDQAYFPKEPPLNIYDSSFSVPNMTSLTQIDVPIERHVIPDFPKDLDISPTVAPSGYISELASADITKMPLNRLMQINNELNKPALVPAEGPRQYVSAGELEKEIEAGNRRRVQELNAIYAMPFTVPAGAAVASVAVPLVEASGVKTGASLAIRVAKSTIVPLARDVLFGLLVDTAIQAATTEEYDEDRLETVVGTTLATKLLLRRFGIPVGPTYTILKKTMRHVWTRSASSQPGLKYLGYIAANVGAAKIIHKFIFPEDSNPEQSAKDAPVDAVP